MAMQATQTECGLQKRVYTIQDIQTILAISRSTAYTFVQNAYKTQEPFPVLRIGSNYRIEKNAFDTWLNGGA